MPRTPLAALVALLVFAVAPAQAITIEQAMADPDWIGPPVQHPYWSVDGQSVYYSLKQNGTQIRDLHRIGLADGKDAIVGPEAMPAADGADAVFDRTHTRAAFVRNGDVFIRDVATARLTQVTRTAQRESAPQFSADGRALQYRSGNDWFVYDIAGGIGGPAAVVKAEKDPDAKKPDDLADLQLKFFSTVREIKADRDAQKKHDEAFEKADPSRAPRPFYVGDDVRIEGTSLAPDGRWLLVFTTPKAYEKGKAGKLQHFVTESGYEEQQDERTRVGRNDPAPQSIVLLDLAEHAQYKLAAGDLPGIHDDPLKAIREENAKRAKDDKTAKPDADKKKDAKDDKPKERAIRIVSDAEDGGGGGVEWSADGRNVAIQIRAIDNKDRWIATVDFGAHKLVTQHRLTDPAWINWSFNEFGWEKDDRTLWYVSEETGYAQLYAKSPGGKASALTHGTFEVSAPVLSPDGKWFYVRANAEAPYAYDVYRVAAGGGELKRISSLKGLQEFGLSPDGRQLALLRSGPYLPPQVALVERGRRRRARSHRHAHGRVQGDRVARAQDRRSAFDAHEAADLRQALRAEGFRRFEEVSGGALRARRRLHAERARAVAVLLPRADVPQPAQRARLRRARHGLPRQRRLRPRLAHRDLPPDGPLPSSRISSTACTGSKRTHSVDANRIGVYGGSYGGFMTLIAMFRAPDVFKAGAALRPVTDWTQYNHEYTSNILNDPQIDPIAYERSSPIEFADGLKGHLLIAHGMIDDNVLFEDSARLYQKLIELHKDNFEIAPYPMERHGFVHADSWLDEYKRIYRLFETSLK